MSGLINLDGKAPENSEYKKIKVSEDVHEGKFKDVKLVEGVDFDTGEKVPKFVLSVTLPEGEVTKWFNPKISKGSGRYSPSEGYVILEKAKLIETLSQFQGSIKEGKEGMEQLAKFFNQYLANKKIKVLTKTIVPKGGTVEDAYSKIDKIISIE